jgi:hypothetical protein
VPLSPWAATAACDCPVTDIVIGDFKAQVQSPGFHMSDWTTL